MNRKSTLPLGTRDWSGILVVFAVAFGIRICLALQQFVYIDRSFLPDDTYYSLAIARNIALGYGPSPDGINLTNGFQPLITFLQVPFFWLRISDDLAARFAVIESAFFGACAAAALMSLISRVASSLSGYIAAAIVCLSPAIIANDMNGLETSLAVLCDLLALHAIIGADEHTGLPHRALLGLILGLSLLARIDSCFVIISMSIIFLRRGQWRFLRVPAIVALATVLPWWLYSFHAVGSFIPESGAAVRQIVATHLGTNYSYVGPVMSALIAVGRFVTSVSWLPRTDLLIGTVLLTGSLIYAGRLANNRGDRATVLKIMIFSGATLFAFYAFFVPAVWFYTRYLHYLQFALVAVISIFLGDRAPLFLRKAALGRLPAVAGGAAILVLGSWWCGQDAKFLDHPAGSIDSGLAGAKGYREVALAILPHLPMGSTLGAMQSGALSYFAPSSVRVVNLDGVVNHNAYEAIHSRRLGKYIENARIGYFADWLLNVRLLNITYDPDGGTPALVLMYTTEPQGSDQFSLYRILQPARSADSK